MTTRAFIYLKRPKMTSAFAVAVVAVDGLAGRLEGEGLEQMARFLRVSGGMPVFDIEYEGRLFHRCRLGGDAAANSIQFWFDSTSSLKSDPCASRS